MRRRKLGIAIALTGLSILGMVDAARAGTGKSLSWCSYVNPKNDKHINRMRCVYTAGMSMTYCFHIVQWRTGKTTEIDCENWIDNLSGRDKERLRYILGEWNTGEPGTQPSVFKNKVTGEIIIVHDNESSYQLEECKKLGFHGAAGTLEPADRCWMGPNFKSY
ncbi:MAG: hypothetical protein N5P05_004101 (plasmid) [Chroococcopsis gigantea SAG 12.99]|nr:hypothetical protein [Chroococcopsis gigantea SAG 12.99]